MEKIYKYKSHVEVPYWFGWNEYHISHRSALLFKNNDWYKQFGWVENAELKYIWPIKKDTACCDVSFN